MAPPTKRRKRNVIISSSPELSDHEDNETSRGKSAAKLLDLISSSPNSSTRSPGSVKFVQTTLPATPTKPRPKATTANHPPNAAPIYLPNRNRTRATASKSVSVSPEKTKGGRVNATEKGKSKDIKTLFSTQAQRTQRAPSEQASTQSQVSLVPADDIDEISDDDEVGETNALNSSFVGAAARKRARNGGSADTDVIDGSQKFIRKPPPRPDTKSEEDTRPWAERFAPTNLDELAVHKKKVADVRGWLEAVMEGQLRQRMLVLKGAAGTGKTTTVQLLAKSLGYDVLEWRNPVGSVSSSDGFLSMAAQFEEFMGRGGKFGQLDVVSDENQSPSKPDIKPLDRRKKIILVEEFPNTFTRSSTVLQSFRSTILQYLAANTPSLAAMYSQQRNTDSITPLVLVISETLLTTTSASADSFTAHRLLGPEILQHPGVTTIDFNAIAPTILAKALELVVLKESRKSGRRRTPGPLVLKRLGEIGDVRSAIGSLEFLCIRGDDTADWGGKVTFTKGKKASKDAPMTQMEQESLELVTRREASLGIFHAVGKVVYNKRDDAPRIDDVESLPEWMEERSRPRKSQVMIDELIDETGTDTQTFIAALHENYALSCEASPTDMNDFSDLDHVNGCLDALSDSDLLCPSWDGSFNSTGFGGAIGGRGSGGDVMRQDELCFQIAVRGILFSLPYPVKRRAANPSAAGSRPGRGGDAFKMFYPTSMKLWRTKEEIESVVDLWVLRLMKGDDYISTSAVTSGAAAFMKRKPEGGVESWNRTQIPSSLPRSSPQGITKRNDDDDTSPKILLPFGTAARTEMLLERLPYMALIAKARKGGTSPTIREMENVTAFSGIGGPILEDEDEGENDTALAAGQEWATDRPLDCEDMQQCRSKGRGMKKMGEGGGIQGAVGLERRFAEQKLVLSDDDIEDF